MQMKTEDTFKNMDDVQELFEAAHRSSFKGFSRFEELTVRLLMQILLTSK